MVTERRSHAYSSANEDEGKVGAKKKSGNRETDTKKKQKVTTTNDDDNDTNNDDGHSKGKSASDIAAEFEEVCKATREHLSMEEMRKLLEANDQDASGSDDAVVPQCQDTLFYGPLEKCPVCGGNLKYTGKDYSCQYTYNEWSTCTYSTKDPRRKDGPVKLPEGINLVVANILKNQNPTRRPKREFSKADKPFAGIMISLSGRLSRTHEYWKREIEKHGGKVSNTVHGVTCLVVSPAERERGGSTKVAEAMERNITVVREAWLIDSIIKLEAQPLEAYDALTDLAPEGSGIPWDKQDPREEAFESLSTELKLYGKRSVHKDSKLQDEGGYIFEKDGILFNCALSACDQGRDVNEFCIMQLIMVPESSLHLYYKKGRIGDDPKPEETVEQKDDVNRAVKEFAQLFEELTGNPFEPWEREKKFEKKKFKFYPIDMDDGIDVRHGGLGLRQLGVAASHCKLEPLVANFMKVLCSREIYRYAMIEMGLDGADLPMGMITDMHIKKCENLLFSFIDVMKSAPEQASEAIKARADFSNKWFTLLHSSRPFSFSGNCHELADQAAAVLECVRDINVASRLVGDMTGATIDDPLFDCYMRLHCSISALDEGSDDYKMILNYVEKTYEPVKVSDVSYKISVENIFAVESSAAPSHEEIKKLPNKVLLWCGTRTSNMLRHLYKGFLPAICFLPAPGYMFGRAIICSDAAADAARYGFTAVDRPEGFLVLAVVSQGDNVTEITKMPEHEEIKKQEEGKVGVKGIGRKKTDTSEHFTWKDDIKVPCGRLIPSEHQDSPLEYDQYAVYDTKEVRLCYKLKPGTDKAQHRLDGPGEGRGVSNVGLPTNQAGSEPTSGIQPTLLLWDIWKESKLSYVNFQPLQASIRFIVAVKYEEEEEQGK